MFNPENVERTEWRYADYEGWYPEPDPSPDETWQWEKPIYTVPASAYDDLLEKYNLLLAAEPARVIPFKNGFWVFAKEYSFFTSRPENTDPTKLWSPEHRAIAKQRCPYCDVRSGQNHKLNCPALKKETK